MTGWLTQTQAAETFDVSERTIRNWVNRTTLPIETVRVHPYTFYRFSDLDKVREEAEQRWGSSGIA